MRQVAALSIHISGVCTVTVRSRPSDSAPSTSSTNATAGLASARRRLSHAVGSIGVTLRPSVASWMTRPSCSRTCRPSSKVSSSSWLAATRSTAGGFSAGVHRGANRGDVALERDRDQAAADLVLLDECDVGGLERRIARLYRRYDSLGFD